MTSAYGWARRGAVLGIAVLIAGPLPAQDAGEEPEGFVLPPIEVIGALAPVRSVLETPVPVDVVGEERLAETGATETGRAIQAAAPSFNFSSSTISDGTDALRPATLRGLGPDQTLVLVNGKRRHPSALVHVNRSVGRGTAGTDMNAIPLASIGRVEVLRDGAAARYGSDAIAGVINLVLKEIDTGGEARATLGQTYEGDGQVRHANAVHGVSLGDGGFLTLTADVRDRGPTNRAGLTGVCQYANNDGCADPARERAFDRKNFRIGDADSLSRGAWFNAGVPLADTADAYAFGGWTLRDNDSGGFYRRANQGSRNPVYGGRQYYPDGFLPLIETDIEDLSIGVGATFVVGGLHIDAGVTHGRNTFDFGVTNSLNAYLWKDEGRAVTEVDSGGLGYRQTSVNVDAQRSTTIGGRETELAVGGEARVDTYTIRAGQRESWYGCQDTADPAEACADAAASGIQVFPGFRPTNEVDESRRSVAVYADSETRLSERTSFGFALRGEDFEDFGTTVNGKATLRYDVTPAFAIRGSASNGFRAPSLHQKFFNNISTQFTPEGGALEVGTFRNDSALARDLGIPQLKEETSINAAVGFVWTPGSATSITLDAYRIDIDDRIMISNFVDASQLAAGCGGDAGCVARVNQAMTGIDEAQFFLNAGTTRTQGIDIVAERETELAGGALRLTGAASWSRTRFEGTFNAPGLLGGLGDNLFGARDKAFVEVAQPRWRLNLEGAWARGPWSLNLGTRVYGPYSVPETDAGALQEYDAKALVDTQIGYEIADGVTLSVGADNLLDVYPDEKNIGLSRNGCIAADGTTGATGTCGADPIVDTNGVFVYSRRAAPFGFNGGFYYARLTLRY